MSQRQQAASAYENWLKEQVQAGKLVGFTVYYRGREEFTPVSRRAAAWLLQALEGKLEACESNPAASRITYQYGTHCATLGTYTTLEAYDFFRGIARYCKRKWKDAERAARRAKLARLEAEKGGAEL